MSATISRTDLSSLQGLNATSLNPINGYSEDRMSGADFAKALAILNGNASSSNSYLNQDPKGQLLESGFTLELDENSDTVTVKEEPSKLEERFAALYNKPTADDYAVLESNPTQSDFSILDTLGDGLMFAAKIAASGFLKGVL